MVVIVQTRKLRWRKDKRATSVPIWKPLAKKSTANQPYAISCWWLIVNVVVLHYLMFARYFRAYLCVS